MTQDPRARLATELRLFVGAALCLAPMGVLWSFTPGFQGAGISVSGTCDSDGLCTPDSYTPGVSYPGTTVLVSEAPVRIFLLLAAATFGYVATRPRTPATRRIARAGTASIGIAAVLAAADGVPLVLLCMLGALALSVPPVWAGRRSSDRREGVLE